MAPSEDHCICCGDPELVTEDLCADCLELFSGPEPGDPDGDE
jgi:hypothetical protein